MVVPSRRLLRWPGAPAGTFVKLPAASTGQPPPPKPKEAPQGENVHLSRRSRASAPLQKGGGLGTEGRLRACAPPPRSTEPVPAQPVATAQGVRGPTALSGRGPPPAPAHVRWPQQCSAGDEMS